MDSPYICHIAMLDCVPRLCQGSCQVFWSSTINLLYRVFSKGIIVAVCLLSIDTRLEQLFENRKLVFENMYMYGVCSLDILSLWGFLTSTSVMESTQNALCERKPLTVDL